MSVQVFAVSGKWHLEINGRMHPRTFDTYAEAAAVANVADKWIGTPNHKPGRTDK